MSEGPQWLLQLATARGYGICFTMGSPAAEMEGDGGPAEPVPVLIAEQGYRRGPGSRANRENAMATARLRQWHGAKLTFLLC